MFGIKIENFVGLWYIADMAIGWIIHAMLKRGWTREKKKKMMWYRTKGEIS
jgi:hypothetical protein